MIDILLQMDKASRAKFTNFVDKAFRETIFNSIPLLTKILKLDDISIYNGRVLKRFNHVKKFPKGIFWDRLEYQSGDKDRLRVYPNTLISTRGDVVTFTNTGRLYINSIIDDEDKDKYRHHKTSGITLNVYRGVASTFVPRPEHLIEVPFTELEVNHKDLTKVNDHYTNLEWVTPDENIKHAKGHAEYIDTDRLLLEVAIDNGFKGVKFSRTKKELFDDIGGKKSNINAALAGALKGIYKGFKITVYKGEECPFVFPDDVKALFDKNERYFNPRYSCLLCTVLTGKHEGLKFALIGQDEVVKYLKTTRAMYDLSRVVRPVCNCKFEFCSMKEAIPYHGMVTEELSNEILNP